MSREDRTDRRGFLKAAATGGLSLAGLAACGGPGSDRSGGSATERGSASEAGAAQGVARPGETGFHQYYEVHGEGPPVVFAHGAGGTHLSWWQQVPAFSAEFACVVYDQRGFGFSPDVPDGPGRSAFVEDLRGLLDDLEIERTALVGQSMGGRSVLGFTAAYPERVDALVLSSTIGGYTDAELDRIRAEAPDPGERSAFSAGYARRDPEGAFLYRSISRTNDYLELERGAEAPRAPLPDLERVVDAGVPVLFLLGDLDTVVPPSVIVALQSKMPGSTLVRFPDSGHSPYWEIPDRFNETVLDFLRG